MGIRIRERMQIKTLETLLEGVDIVKHHTEGRNPELKSLTSDSRKVTPDSMFVALPGHKADGNYYIHDALESGAACVISQDPPSIMPDKAAFVQVRNARKALSRIAANYYQTNTGKSTDVKVIGVTGTNGKTTTTYLLQAILGQAFGSCGLVGTVKTDLGGGAELPSVNTTPGPLEIHGYLDEMRRNGIKYAALEISSHGLVQHRADDLPFAAGIFSNLTQDHLDYHGTMEEYAKAKGRLFELLDDDAPAILNLDDPQSIVYARLCRKSILYGFNRNATVWADKLNMDAKGMTFTLVTPSGSEAVRLPLIGLYNVSNALAASACAWSLGISLPVIAEALKSVVSIPGRLEPVPGAKDVTVLVDYAHTPDAIENVLKNLKQLKHNRILTVFGCGGDRDRGKRPLMARAAAAMSDLVIVTSDNPRTEDPRRILNDVVAGIPAGTNHSVQPDRALAIREAIELALPGDIVLIAGKGHETYQILKDGVIQFDDRKVAAQFRRELKK